MDSSAENLITVAVVQSAVEANLVKNQLEAVGIKTYLADEEAVAMAWHMAGAFGGIKLQVAAHDAEDAQAFLDQRPWQDQLEASPMVATLEKAQTDDEEEEPLSAREQIANRACRAAVFGLLFWPLEAYAFWLLLQVYFSTEKLTGRSRANAKLGGAINAVVLAGFCMAAAVFIRGPVTPAIDLSELPHPQVFVGTWESKPSAKKEEIRLWLQMKANGRAHYREGAAADIEFQGTWAFKNGHLLLVCDRVIKGDNSRNGKLVAHEVEDFKAPEMSLRIGNDKVLMVRVQ